jgi:hypothetical protein
MEPVPPEVKRRTKIVLNGPMRLTLRQPPAVIAIALLTACAVVGRPRQSAAQGWADARFSGPFVCRAEFSLARFEGLLNEVAQLQDDLVRCLGVPPAQERIELYLFRNEHTYRRYLQLYLPNVPYRRALYVNVRGRAMVLAYRSRQFEIDVRHECTHALLHAALPEVPLWLDEGLAEYFELAPSKRAFDNPYLGNLRWSIRLGKIPRLDSLEKKRSLSEMRRTEYRDAWAWVHFMLLGSKQAHTELVGFLRDIRKGAPPGLLSERLRRRLPETHRHFAAHIKRWKR